jgi:archaellum component FlaF (FlaF/FlaG flagellin family)
MIKKILISIFLVVSLNANDLLDQKIENFIGTQSYLTHKNLVNFIFKKEYQYITVDGLNYQTILKTLKENGLLTLAFNEPKNIEVTFKINSSPIKSLKILKDTLKSLGYYYYFTKHTVYDTDQSLTWTIKLKTEAAIDPLVLSNELFQHDCKIVNITKEENDKWVYELDTSNASLYDATYISNNEKVSFSKPLSPYFIKVDKASKIFIASKSLNSWLPYVVFYDDHLNILKVSKEERVYRNLTLPIPENTKYIKISDLYTLFNIKRGLTVLIKE